jgi:hypothetical protein
MAANAPQHPSPSRQALKVLHHASPDWIDNARIAACSGFKPLATKRRCPHDWLMSSLSTVPPPLVIT